jgi:type VI secretion system protein VasL
MMKLNPIPLPNYKIRGHSPAHHPGFLALSSEMNTLSKNKLARVDWERMSLLCQRIFQQEGCDPWTGVWFCYINAKQQEWAGLALAVEQLVSTLHFLPSGDTANKKAALNWFAQHIGDVLYALPDAPGNRISMQRTAKGLNHLMMIAADREATSTLNVMVSYINHKAKENKHEYSLNVSRPGYAMVEMPAVQVAEAAKNTPELHDMDVSIGKKNRKIVLKFFVMFSLISLLLILLGHQYVTREQSRLLQLFNGIEALEKKAATVDMAKLESDYASNQQVKEMFDVMRNNRPEWLLALPVLQDLAVLHPDNNEKTFEKLNGWNQLHQQLDHLEKRLLASEKGAQKHLTISELKTEVYEIRKKLNVLDTPLEVISESTQGNDTYTRSERDFFDNKVRSLLTEHYRF